MLIQGNIFKIFLSKAEIILQLGTQRLKTEFYKIMYVIDDPEMTVTYERFGFVMSATL